MKIDGTRAYDRATELVLAYYAAFNRGDWAGMQALLADDVAHDLNQGPRETGKPAFAAFQERMARVPPPSTSCMANTWSRTMACRRRTGRSTCCPVVPSSTSAMA